jgi:MinD-like ATPase involved in chromosome partitioning or flagellar assembly
LKKSDGIESKILLFTSAKGGSGCSFISSCVAAYLARNKNENVLYIDLNTGKKDSRLIFNLTDENYRDLGDLENVLDDIDIPILKKLVINQECSLNLILPSLRVEKENFLRGNNLEKLFNFLKENFEITIVDFPYYLFFEKEFDFNDCIDKLIFISLPDLVSISNLELLSKNLCFNYISHKIDLVINKSNNKPAIPPSRLASILKFPIRSFIPYDKDVELLFLNNGPSSLFNYNLRIIKSVIDFSNILYESLAL